MRYDIYLIILTGFAVFGIYYFFETLLTFFTFRNMPASVMIVKNNTDNKTIQKVKLAEQNIPNNYIVLYPFEEEKEKNFEDYIKDVLNVNN